MKTISRRGFIKGAALGPVSLNVAAFQKAALGERAFDFVVAGAGHNSLITAAYLAKAGFSVVVLEGRPTIGGGCKTAEACHPGFHEDLCSSVHGFIQNDPVLRDNELNLGEYGLSYVDPDPIMHISFPDRSWITMWHDLDRTCEEYARYSKKDAGTFRALVGEYQAYNAARGSGAAVPDEALWRRRFAMSAYDLITQTFESRQVQSLHLATGRFGSVPAGHPGTGRQMFTSVRHQVDGRPMAVGGSGMLPTALARVIRAHGGVIRTNMPVVQLVMEGGQCRGVECADGSVYRARKAVVSTIHIRHLVDMAPKPLWGDAFVEQVGLLQPEPAMFAFHYAVTEAPTYQLADGGAIAPAESTLLPVPERVLYADYEHATGEINLDNLPLQIVVPSIADDTRAPPGMHTLKLEGNLPYALPGGPQQWDEVKDAVADKVFAYFGQFCPNMTPDKILGKFIQSPLDIERMNPAMWRGSVHAMGYGPGQMGDMRPVPGWAEYRMPIPGLYQTGACTAPGGSVRGTPGRNAAKAILEDHGSSLAQAVAGA